LFISISLAIIGSKYTAFFEIIGDLFSWNHPTLFMNLQKKVYTIKITGEKPHFFSC